MLVITAVEDRVANERSCVPTMDEDEWNTLSTAKDDEIAALRAIVEGTARNTGEAFFQSLVQHLAAVLGVSYAFVAEFAGSRDPGPHARLLG